MLCWEFCIRLVLLNLFSKRKLDQNKVIVSWTIKKVFCFKKLQVNINADGTQSTKNCKRLPRPCNVFLKSCCLNHLRTTCKEMNKFITVIFMDKKWINQRRTHVPPAGASFSIITSTNTAAKLSRCNKKYNIDHGLNVNLHGPTG